MCRCKPSQFEPERVRICLTTLIAEGSEPKVPKTAPLLDGEANAEVKLVTLAFDVNRSFSLSLADGDPKWTSKVGENHFARGSPPPTHFHSPLHAPKPPFV